MKGKIFVAALALLTVPMFSGAALAETIVGNTCLVPVFHTDFAFPPEGGKIVKIGSQMYFVTDYVPGCENAGSNGVVIKTSNGFVTGTANTQINSAVPRHNCNACSCLP